MEKSSTIFVACNLRTGLRMGIHTVNGYFQAPGEAPPQPSIRGYMITEGFPRDVWEDWFKINEKEPFVTKGFLIAGDTMEEVRAAVLRFAGAKTSHIFGSTPYVSGR